MRGIPPHILLVEDNPGDARLIREILADIRGEDTPAVERMNTLAKALDYLEHFKPDIILLDLGLPDSQGLVTVQRVALKVPEIPVIVLTGAGDDDLAVEAIKAGAQDYMMKGLVKPETLMKSLLYSMERKHIEEELHRHRNHLEELVQSRTRELEEKYAQLEEEIADRKHAEKEKEKLEKQLHQAQKMEALGRFAGGIAHDLNNILYPMIINTEILLEDTAPNSSLHKTLKQVLDGAYRQRDLIKQILSFSRKEERKLEPICLSEVIQETMKFIRSALPSTIAIHMDNRAEHDTILGDSTQIYQVMMNLCKNASDAIGGQDGTLDILIENTRLDSVLDLPPGEYIRISVRDSGCGMTPDVMSQIFDPFYTTKGMGKGNGMGLSIVHGIIKGHEGSITAESEPGRGSSFTIHLPVMKISKKRKAASAGREPAKILKAKILLVDDEAIILSSIQTALSRMNFDVTSSSNGLEALDIFISRPEEFDLVITDFTMPHISGMDLSTRILKVRPDIPIILCTGFNEDIDEKEVKASGIRELLIKPTSMGELRDVIQKTLEN